jgi:hypothetical protein
MDDRSLAALFAFVCDAPDFFKGEGGLRKRILDEGKRIFPSLDLELLAGGLRCLGLLRMEETRLCPDWGKSEIFAGLSRRERLEYWAAGICLYLRSGASARHFHRGQIQALACFIHCLMDALEPGRLFPRLTLRRIVELQEQGEPRGFRQTDSEAFLKVRDPEGFENLLEALEKTGLLIAVSPGYWQNGIGPASPGPEGSGPGASDPEPSGRKPAETGLPLIAMDTAFSCILYPEIGFAEALTLASFSSVRETGTTVRFEITRESAVRGFDRGLNAEAIVDLLTRISGKAADQNLVWTLHDWENRYSAVSLYHGTVLTLSEERRYLAETEPLLSRIDRTLAPGVYLLPAGEQDEILQNLQKAGVDIVARPPGKTAVSARTGSAGNEHSLYPPPEAAARRRGLGGGAYGQGRQSPQRSGPDPEKTRACKERFRAALEKLKLPAAEREELAARIERRLIVSESQLAGAAVRSEKLEARHLDYVGKTLVAKQAIALKAMVEVIWPGTEGETKRVLGVPETLEKTGGETVLVLKYRQGESAPEELVRIPIGKISLLRRIKKSLFME